MRVGKRANVVEAKKTRSCIVRLEKVESPPSKVTRRTNLGCSIRGVVQDERNTKGPFKKRPVTQTSTPTAMAPATPKMQAKDKLKLQQKSVSRVAQIIEDESPPPTIAAGRSRRAIKPNPKYASDDMVTPKIIKNVASLGTSALKRGTASTSKQRAPSSSSEDFYNKESSDELDADEVDEDDDDKMYNDDGKDSDSDFSNKSDTPTPVARKRGRPKKVDASPASTSRILSSSTATRSTPTVKATPSQLQQLRKTFAASASREASSATIGIKRKRESVSENETGIARKRFIISGPEPKAKTILRDSKSSETSSPQSVTRKVLPTQTVNGSKVFNLRTPQLQRDSMIANAQEKRKLMMEKAIAIAKMNAKPFSAKSLDNTSVSSKPTNSTFNSKIVVATKQRSASPATPKVAKSKEITLAKKKTEESPSTTVDDFETMPTFTIVNINDIINKKGDVLISKASGKHGTGKSPKGVEAAKDESTLPAAANTSTSDNKMNRRKPGPATILSDKVDTHRVKSPLPRTPFPQRKTTQKILNHTLGKKAISVSPEKPAPRILNAMVAKKTQPVKPMIANLDDSADESFPLSLDEYEDDEDEEKEATADEDVSFVGKRRLPTSTPYPVSKKVATVTKENSLAANNRLPVKMPQRKLSPEKVVISRHGDKVVKKITCFETWYVINIPEDRPSQNNVRNQLEIPLIDLANDAKQVSLPSESWSCKVTLYQLSAAMMAKSTLTTYTGDLQEQNIPEEDRARYQPSCVMFRRAVSDRFKSRLPYDRAVIFKNKTFFTNIEGKNVKLVGAPITLDTLADVEILLEIVDSLTLQSSLVEPATTIQ